jgi:hypothetical protein
MGGVPWNRQPQGYHRQLAGDGTGSGEGNVGRSLHDTDNHHQIFAPTRLWRFRDPPIDGRRALPVRAYPAQPVKTLDVSLKFRQAGTRAKKAARAPIRNADTARPGVCYPQGYPALDQTVLQSARNHHNILI